MLDLPYKFNYRMTQGVSGCPTIAQLREVFGDDWKQNIAETYTLNTKKDGSLKTVDEMVNETPVIARPVAVSKKSSTKSNPLGLEYSANDNEALYEVVNEWLGVPYKYGGTDRNGIDCSAFVGVVYRKVYGINLHRTSNDMLRDVDLIGRSQLREGDILFFTNSKGKVSHVGVYLKDNLFAHSSTSNGVSVSNLNDSYWQKHFYKGGRTK